MDLKQHNHAMATVRTMQRYKFKPQTKKASIGFNGGWIKPQREENGD